MESSRPDYGARRLWGPSLMVAIVLAWSGVAHAQAPGDDSGDFQYDEPTPPFGPASGTPVSVLEDDVLTFEGPFTVAAGASVTLEDTDGTRLTLVDGRNADIAGSGGRVTVAGGTGHASGGDGALELDETSVAATTGVSPGSPGARHPSVDVLPETGGGPLLTVVLGASFLAGAGLLVLRRPARR